MARLAALEKGLHYPTPSRVIDLIADLVNILEPDPGAKILDVCAGEGTAVSALANRLGMQSYGVELDSERAAVANEKMSVCLAGSYHQLIADQAFQCLFLNPPYDHVADQDGVSSRQEVQFLVDASKWLVPGGLVIFVPPRHILSNSKFLDYMRKSYTGIRAWSFPHPEVASFDQVVVLARKTASTAYYHYGDTSSLARPDELPVLGGDPSDRFEWRRPRTEGFVSFQLAPYDPVTNAPSWSQEAPSFGYASKQWDLACGARGSSSTRPLVAPRPGHQAMLLAAGALDGCELDGRTLLKGGSEKITTELEEGDQVVERERIVSRLSVLDLESGEYESWRADEDPARTATWFQEHGDELAQAIQNAYTPSFDGNLAPYRDILATLTAPGILPGRNKPEFLLQQQEAAAAVAHWWKQGNKSGIISGEMGTGKTSMAILASMLAGHEKVIVMCPSHLTGKWARECETIIGRKKVAFIAKKLSDVDAFFASSSARFMILSKETAKLGARWEPRFTTRLMVVEREVVDLDAAPSGYGYGYGRHFHVPKKIVKQKVEVVTCPDCGRAQEVGGHLLGTDYFEDGKVQRSCIKCSAPMWQYIAISDKGTKRYPLARYIRQRYARRYALVLDEVHQYAKNTSDQSKAAQDLISSARKVVALTGTLYGGRASSIFHLLYKLDHTFRTTYGYDECDRFVQHHGLFEKRYDEEERTSVYGYRRGGKKSGGRIREIPGMSPAMIPTILPFTIFVKLKDLRLELPPYSETVEIIDHVPDILAAAQSLQGDVKNILREHPDILGQYLMSCLGYPDCPEQEEEIISTDKDTDEKTVVASAPAFAQRVLPKDQRVVDIVTAEKKEGRQVLVYFSQTHRRDARQRVKAALEDAGHKVKILDASVSPEKREEWISKAVADGFDCMLTNGRLVETGMDLLFASTIIQYGTEYSIPSLRQSIRRSWRLGQRKPIRVIFLAYRDTMQETALSLIARKMRAAEAVDGDETGGLAQHDESGNNFLVELAQEAVSRGSIYNRWSEPRQWALPGV